MPHLKSDDIKDIFSKVLKNLTELGFVVVSVTTDGHRTNQSSHNSLGTEVVHPEIIVNPFSSFKNARVYTMYDTVPKECILNLLKILLVHPRILVCTQCTILCICSRIFTSICLIRSLFSAHLSKNVVFLCTSITVILFSYRYNIEYGNEAKMAYKLTDRVLHPSSIERSNVQLAISAMHETTIAALEYYGGKDEHKAFKDTAQFLKLVHKWFDAVNVKSPFIYKRPSHSTRKPVTRDCKDGLLCIS